MRSLSIAAATYFSVLAFVFQPMTNAQSRSEPKYVSEAQTFPLWDHAAPDAVGNTDEDKPSLTYYSPVTPDSTRTAVIVAPGGSYHMLASNHEGRQVNDEKEDGREGVEKTTDGHDELLSRCSG